MPQLCARVEGFQQRVEAHNFWQRRGLIGVYAPDVNVDTVETSNGHESVEVKPRIALHLQVIDSHFRILKSSVHRVQDGAMIWVKISSGKKFFSSVADGLRSSTFVTVGGYIESGPFDTFNCDVRNDRVSRIYISPDINIGEKLPVNIKYLNFSFARRFEGNGSITRVDSIFDYTVF